MERITQVLNYLVGRCSPERGLSKLEALKLVYLADRYHLRKYASPIIWDNYLAMTYGPVATDTRSYIEYLSKGWFSTDYLSATREQKPSDPTDTIVVLRATRATDLAKFSQTEIEALDAAIAQYKKNPRIVEYTHRFPEWIVHKDKLAGNLHAYEPMDYLDFFRDAGAAEYCDADARLVALNRAIFIENTGCEA